MRFLRASEVSTVTLTGVASRRRTRAVTDPLGPVA